MAGYLTYFPGARVSGVNLFTDAGCGALLDASKGASGPMFCDVLEAGPDGGIGILAWWDNPLDPSAVPRATVDVATQTWRKASAEGDKPAGRYWLGYENARPVRPRDVQRRTVEAGEPIELTDGQSWNVPTIRQSTRTIDVDEAGELVMALRQDAANLFTECGRMLDGLLAANGLVTFAEYFAICVRVLAVNYRVNRDVAAMLKLFDTSNIFRMLAVALDLDKLAANAQGTEKKTG